MFHHLRIIVMTLSIIFLTNLFAGYYGKPTSEDCQKNGTKLVDNKVIISYSTNATIFPVAVIEGKSLTAAEGTEGANLKHLENIFSKKKMPVTWSAYWEQIGIDRCEYYFSPESKPSDLNLYSSKPSSKLISQPSKKDHKQFNQWNNRCVIQGDHPADNQPPCTKSKLLGKSDIDKDGNIEYWYSVPYIWDTGIEVSELNQKEDTFIKLISICRGCD